MRRWHVYRDFKYTESVEFPAHLHASEVLCALRMRGYPLTVFIRG